MPMIATNKHNITQTYLLTLLFCLPFSGTDNLFAFMAIGQLVFICMVFVNYRKDAPSTLKQFQLTLPKTFAVFWAWLFITFVSFAFIFIEDSNGWQRAAAIARQIFILLQTGFCLSLIRFYSVSKKPFSSALKSFGAGFIALAILHFLVLYFGPACESETWLKDPFLSPNMRDIGDLATAAIAIFSVMYWLSQQKRQSGILLVCLILSCTYLLWSGGRTAIASSAGLSLLTFFVCHFYAAVSREKIILTALGLITAYLLCVQLSIYDWNGLVRYSSNWKPDFNPHADITSGRMDMWKWSIDAFLQAPWFGHGPYSFYFLPERFEHQFWHDHPHNLIIQCLIEWGITGTILLLALLGSIAIFTLRHLPALTAARNVEFLACAGAVLVLSVGSLTGGSYWDFQPVIMLTTAFAGLLLSLTSHKK